jgi:benzodiazapine receptor
MQTSANKLKWWQVALISVAVSALGSLSGLRSSKQQKKLYDTKLKQAPWAPPSWVFAPAWTLNNYFLLNAMRRIIGKDMPEKRKLLLLQAGIWFIFFTFNYIYFRKKSPVLAAIWTMSDNILAIASMLISAKADKKLSLNYLPLVLWTSFASTLSDYQALKNPDPVLKTRALLR